MNRLYYVAAVALLAVFVIACAFLQTLNNHAEAPKTNPSALANLRTFDWQLGGVDFQYPATWSVLSWASSSAVISHLELISSAGGTPKYQPYFCLDLSVNPPMSDLYQLQGGGVVANAGNGLLIYQRFLETGGTEELQAWLTNAEQQQSSSYYAESLGILQSVASSVSSIDE